MALHTPPSWLQNASHPAENDRLTTQALWATTGIIASASLAVTANSPAAMNVYVADGWAAIVGTTQADMGTYVAYNDASVLLTITTANPTNPRIDLICMTVNDSYYTGVTDNVVFQVIAGTPSATPVAPSVPANSISLATISVAAGATAINTGNITDTRVSVTTNLPIGDITGVTAGTGLTGGGTSGAVTLDIDSTVATLTGSQTLTNKILTAPQVNLGINAQSGTTYTTALADNGKLVTLTNGSSIALTIPLNSSVAYPVGAQLNLARLGAGAVTIAGAGGVTVVSTGATAATPGLRAQYSTATAVQTSIDNWLVMGDIS
jgi:hypothetical protein